MPSEKSKYFNKNKGPEMPYDMGELINGLPQLGAARLAHIIAVHSESNDVLLKLLCVSLAFQPANFDFEFLKRSITYALYFPEYVRYTESGHGQILDEILIGVEDLVKQESSELAKQLAQYALEKGHEVAL